MSIIDNRKAFYDYSVEERYEAGLVLEGWEVKALRAGRGQIKEGYVVIKNNELFLIGTHISPLPEASTHINPDPVRTRKLLLHSRRDQQTDRQGRAARLHARAAELPLQGRPRQMRDRSGQG